MEVSVNSGISRIWCKMLSGSKQATQLVRTVNMAHVAHVCMDNGYQHLPLFIVYCNIC